MRYWRRRSPGRKRGRPGGTTAPCHGRPYEGWKMSKVQGRHSRRRGGVAVPGMPEPFPTAGGVAVRPLAEHIDRLEFKLNNWSRDCGRLVGAEDRRARKRGRPGGTTAPCHGRPYKGWKMSKVQPAPAGQYVCSESHHTLPAPAEPDVCSMLGICLPAPARQYVCRESHHTLPAPAEPNVSPIRPTETRILP